MNRAEMLDKILLMLVGGVKADQAEEAAVEAFGIKLSDAKALVIDARKSITLAADFNRATEIGTAYIRLNDLYSQSLTVMDQKTALAAQKELNKLLRLYDETKKPGDVIGDEGSDGGLDAQELAAIAAHLRPLNIAPEGYPLHEIARIAADMIRDAKTA